MESKRAQKGPERARHKIQAKKRAPRGRPGLTGIGIGRRPLANQVTEHMYSEMVTSCRPAAAWSCAYRSASTPFQIEACARLTIRDLLALNGWQVIPGHDVGRRDRAMISQRLIKGKIKRILSQNIGNGVFNI